MDSHCFGAHCVGAHCIGAQQTGLTAIGSATEALLVFGKGFDCSECGLVGDFGGYVIRDGAGSADRGGEVGVIGAEEAVIDGGIALIAAAIE